MRLAYSGPPGSVLLARMVCLVVTSSVSAYLQPTSLLGRGRELYMLRTLSLLLGEWE